MVNLTDTDKEFIKNNFENYDEIINLNYRDLLLELNILLTTKGMDDNDDYNDLGRKGQKVYDNIYQNN